MSDDTASKASDTGPLTRHFALFTGGKHPDIDLLGVVVECFEDMDAAQIQTALGYLNARFLDRS